MTTIDETNREVHTPPELMPAPPEWHAAQIADTEHRISTLTDLLNKAVRRTAEANCWLKALKSSLPAE